MADSKKGIYSLATTVAIIMIILSGGITLYGAGHYLVLYDGETKAENELNTLLAKLDSFKQLSQQMHKKIEEANSLEKKIRLSYGIAPVHKELRMVGVGGRRSLSSQADGVLGDPLILEAQILKNKIKEYGRKASFADTTFDQVEEYIRKEELHVTAKPSLWPVDGYVTSEFGKRRHPVLNRWVFHDGIDISNVRRTPIIAPADGICKLVKRKKGYGITVDIDHTGSGYMTRYAHLNKALVKSGDIVSRGDTIALLGSTGRSTGPHLHYEVHKDGRLMNPRNYFLKTDQIYD